MTQTLKGTMNDRSQNSALFTISRWPKQAVGRLDWLLIVKASIRTVELCKSTHRHAAHLYKIWHALVAQVEVGDRSVVVARHKGDSVIERVG